MSDMNVSAPLASAIKNVLGTSSVTEFTMDIQFTNTNDSSYNYSPPWVESIEITDSFAEKISEKIVLNLTMAPTDYIQLFNNSKDLQVAIRFVYYDSQNSQRVFTPTPISRIYKAMLINPVDLSKKYTTGSLMPTSSMPLTEQHISARIPAELHLIEASAYTIKQRQFHGIYQKQKVGDVIAHIAQSFGVKQLYLVPPDNTMVWDHIVVPPTHGIDDIFDYLQYTYGVYMKGIDWYYTNNILYVYPAYENNPSIKYNADIYNAASGSYAGLHSYHSIDSTGTRLGVVSTTKVNTVDISRQSAENVGSGFSFMRASSIVDKFVTNNKNGTFINNNNALTVGTVTDRTVSSSSNNPRHTKTTDNIFDESSKLAKWNTVLIECGWKNAVPFLLYPGHNIKYHFDKNGSLTTQQGILERVIYHFKRQRQTGSGFSYAGDAELKFRANSDVTNAPQTISL